MSNFDYSALTSLGEQLKLIQRMSMQEQFQLGQTLLQDQHYELFAWMYPHTPAFSQGSLFSLAATLGALDVCNLWLSLDNPKTLALIGPAFASSSEQEAQESFQKLKEVLTKKQGEKLFLLTVETQNRAGFHALLPAIRNTECLYEAFKKVSEDVNSLIQPIDFKDIGNAKSIFWSAIQHSDATSLHAIVDVLFASKRYGSFLLQATPRIFEKGQDKWEMFINTLPLDGQAEELWGAATQEPTTITGGVGAMVLSALEQRRLNEALPEAPSLPKLRL